MTPTTVVSPEIQLPGVSDVIDAWTAGHTAYAIALALVLAVALVRRYGGPRYPWLHTDQGSSILVMLGAFGASCATALSTGGAFTMEIAWAALSVAVTAAGGYALIKQIIVTPILCKWEATASPSVKKALRLVLWVFCHKSDTAACAAVPATTAAPASGVPVTPESK